VQLIAFLTKDNKKADKVRERLNLAMPAIPMIVDDSPAAVIARVQSLPITTVLVDTDFPTSVTESIVNGVRAINPDMQIFAVEGNGLSGNEWYKWATDLLNLDDKLEIFLHRLNKGKTNDPIMETVLPVQLPLGNNLLENSEFANFANIFSCNNESELADKFINWVGQAAHTTRAMLLLREDDSGNFTPRAHRGIPQALVSSLYLPQVSPLIQYLSSSGQIALRGSANREVNSILDYMQATVATPIFDDGQLTGIITIGTRVTSALYTATELHTLYMLGNHFADALRRQRSHIILKNQNEMTEQMLTAMPNGAVVLDADYKIAFVNPAAERMLGKAAGTLTGRDLRSLPAPLGDLAYAALIGKPVERQEIIFPLTSTRVAVSGHKLATTDGSSMLLLEDLSLQVQLEDEKGKRVNLEVITNLVHYLAHELRNPLVTLSTFSNLMPTHAGDPDFINFCGDVLQPEVNRVNLMLEQLLVLTNHAEFQFEQVLLVPMIERVIGPEEIRTRIKSMLPHDLPAIIADRHRLETALVCLIRSMIKIATIDAEINLSAFSENDKIVIELRTESKNKNLSRLMEPWDQFLSRGVPEDDLDLGLPAARYIIGQHEGDMSIVMDGDKMTVLCNLPLNRSQKDGGEKEKDDTKSSTYR
jgi:nitrogen-specific signal transduction histidine kinase